MRYFNRIVKRKRFSNTYVEKPISEEKLLSGQLKKQNKDKKTLMLLH